MIAQWNVRFFKGDFGLGSTAGARLPLNIACAGCSVLLASERLRDEASAVQPSASVDRGDQWWDLSQSTVSARTPNLIDGDKVASVVAIAQIWQPMSAHLNRVQVARNIECRVDSDPERVPPGWLQILPAYMKYSPVASEPCAWSKSGPLDP